MSKVNHHSLKYKMQHQPNKKYKDLKQKQKAKFADWLFGETCRFFSENERMPVDEKIEVLAKTVYEKICSLAIWVPYEELLKEYRDISGMLSQELLDWQQQLSDGTGRGADVCI